MKSLAVLASLVALLQQAPVQPGQPHVQKVVVNVTDTSGTTTQGRGTVQIST